MKVNEDKTPHDGSSESPRPAPETSAIAQLISEQLTGTTEHADAVDKLIRENGDLTCIYCAELTLHGLTLNEQGFWESTARQTMAEHMLACPKRPEKKLLEKIEELETRATWQPIETAPDDGTEVLVLDNDTGEVRVGIRKMYSQVKYEQTGKHWYEWFRDDKFAPGHTWSVMATHWMPLPAPPSTTITILTV